MPLVTVRRMREHLNYYLILSVSILIKDIPVEIARIDPHEQYVTSAHS